MQPVDLNQVKVRSQNEVKAFLELIKEQLLVDGFTEEGFPCSIKFLQGLFDD